LQTMVAEIYGPDAQTRRQVATDMTAIFESSKDVVDVDNYMTDDYGYWRFEVDIEKATRYGISVDSINQQLDMAMGGYKLGDIKREVVREPTYIVMQVPMDKRAQVSRLYSLPVMSSSGNAIPLGELGRFAMAKEDPIVFHKDLRAVEYVTAEMEGKLGAPIYGMHSIEDKLKNYVTPDNQTITGLTLGGTIGRYGAPEDNNQSGFEWGGEWTVTYETFRDMGAAFMAALLLIYALIVWEFKNFTLAGLIMAPIPLTLIGIVPGHLIIGAEFTATSMIGFIALAGIIVRNSILLVEFVKHEVESGKGMVDAVISAGQIRMRPILITAGTLMVGAAMLFSDPIFVGMAASLFFGTLVATVLTLVVIPLGCITVRKQFYELVGIDAPEEEAYLQDIEQTAGEAAQEKVKSGIPLWLIVWTKVIAAATWAFYIARAIYFIAQMALTNFVNKIKSRFTKPENDHKGPDDPGPGSSPGGSSGGPAPKTDGPDSSGPSSAPTPESTVESVPVSNKGKSQPVTETSGKTVEQEPATIVKPESKVKDEVSTASTVKKTTKKKTSKKKASTKKASTKKTSKKKATSSKKKTAAKKRRGIRLKEI